MRSKWIFFGDIGKKMKSPIYSEGGGKIKLKKKKTPSGNCNQKLTTTTFWLIHPLGIKLSLRPFKLNNEQR
jgi:hypothetical protein